MEKVFVTGVAGFIGSKTVEFLLDDGVEVVGIDDMNDYYDIRIKQLRLQRVRASKNAENFTFIEGDIENLGLLEKTFKEHQFDAVFNIAARAGVRYSMVDPYVYVTTNTNATLNLLECMRKNNVKKFLLSSTSSLYAGQQMPYTEDLPVNTPISPYAASKKAAEMLAYSYHHLYDIDVSVVRYFTVFGPAGRPDMNILRFIKWIDAGETIELFGDGEQSRDFTYIDDVARGTIAAGKKMLGFEIINIGGGNNPISINQTIRWTEERLGKKAKIMNLPFHKADMLETWADISKAEKLLGWKPEIPVKDGMDRTFDDFIENADFYRKIVLP